MPRGRALQFQSVELFKAVADLPIGEEAVTTDGIVVDETYHWVAKYSGDDPDDRLDNALSAASAGDTIMLENKIYEDD